MDEEQKNEDTYLAEYGLDENGAPLADPELATTAAHDEHAETPEEEAGEPSAEQVAEGEVPAGEHQADFSQLLDGLKAAGINSMDDIHAALAQSQVAAQMQGELATLEAQLHDAVANGDMTPEAAQMVFDAKQEALEAKATIQAQQMQLEMAKQAQAQQALAKIDPSLAKAVGQIGLAPEQITALADALNSAVNTNKQKAVAEYVAGKKDAAPAPISERGSGPKEEDVDVDKFSFSDLFAMSK